MTFLGSIGGAPFNCAFWFTSDGTGTHASADLATDANAVITGFGFPNIRTSWANFNHVATQIQQLRLDYYAASSAAVLASGVKTGIALSGTVSSASAASQSIVCTSISGLAGRSGKGRTYWPATGGISSATPPYEFTSANTLLFSGNVADWLSAINAAAAFVGSGKLRASVQSLRLGVMTPTLSVKVDGRPDRQEHRESKLSFGSNSKVVTP